MINRDNYHDILIYLRYCQEVRQNAKGSLNLRWNQLRHLLEWADETPFARTPRIRPTLPEYLTTAGNGQTRGEHLSHRVQGDVCRAVQAFFTWAKSNRKGYRGVSPVWIESIKPARQTDAMPQQENIWTIEDVRAIATFDPPTLTLKREQAAIVMMFLSGMRVGAFVTLPIKAVRLVASSVDQFPGLGMHTKGFKAATTHLLHIPDLLTVVEDWHKLVNDHLSPDDMWYAHIATDGTQFLPGMPRTDTRVSRVRKGMRQLCDLTGVEYKKPHALRHGHIRYALARSESFTQAKAISQNVMHSSITTTDKVYGVFDQETVKEQIEGLLKEKSTGSDTSALAMEIANLVVAQLKKQ